MYALVDCNNFYASCERLFQPKLRGRPVVVLSNNDGCVIARSDEAKAIGIAMGTPAHLSHEMFREHDVRVFSSNYTLYGDISDRVMQTLASFVPQLELYSIDEAFLDCSELGLMDLSKLSLDIRRTVMQNIGIPVSVGVAPTKTLAKMANRYAKKKYKSLGVFYAANNDLVNQMLSETNVEDIWGIGRQYTKLLQGHGFKTALDLSRAPEEWMRTSMTVVGQRLWNELNGIPSIEWEFEAAPKKNICTSRSFGKLTGDKELLREAVSNYAARCAVKLRKQHSVCRSVNIFLNTNPHKTDHRQYMPSVTIECETPTSDTGELIAYALKGLDFVYQKGYLFMKCGVIVNGLIHEDAVQQNMFDSRDREKHKKAANAMDKINRCLGKDAVRMAVQRFDNRYKLRADHLSKRYTTNINEILRVKI
ncbi:Y-family DNA polymerase [Sediminibacterium roseum]|uniref:Y-family DNA polymerase n=1 Tax=Sediminibacterium roseum TaxID=1978412 RepID=A0ABW9ZW67_9BACT|nr:Y-family DNA polymerase [Sediminibacterium roseum]NCI51370.1 Y-family DNA polymerase [Sediminibacterium roseum]